MRTNDGPAQRFDCPVDGFQKMISGKYKLRILWELRGGTRRFGEIRRSLAFGTGGGAITARVLSRELKAMVELGLLIRKDHQTVPPHVDYALSPLGRSLLPVIETMHRWGLRHLVRRAALQAARRGSMERSGPTGPATRMAT